MNATTGVLAALLTASWVTVLVLVGRLRRRSRQLGVLGVSCRRLAYRVDRQRREMVRLGQELAEVRAWGAAGSSPTGGPRPAPTCDPGLPPGASVRDCHVDDTTWHRLIRDLESGDPS